MIRQIHDLDAFSREAAALDALVADCGLVAPEQTFASTRAFLLHKCPTGTQWTCLLAFNEAELVGALTLIHGPRLGFGRFSVQLFKTPFDFFHTACGTLLIKPGHERVLAEMIQALGKEQRCLPIVRLLTLPNESTAIAALGTIAKQLGIVERPVGGENYIPIRGTFSDYQQRIQTKFQRELRRRERRLGEQGAVRYRFETDARSNQESLQRFMEIENSGWKGQDGTSILARPGDAAFFAEVTQAFAEAGVMRWGFLEAGNETIAGQLVVLVNRSLSVWKVGYREDFAAYAPSNLLLYRFLEGVHESGEADDVAFGSDRPYQREFGTQQRGFTNLIVCPPIPGLAAIIRLTLHTKVRLDALKLAFRQRLSSLRKR